MYSRSFLCVLYEVTYRKAKEVNKRNTELQHKIKFVSEYVNISRFGICCFLSRDDERKRAESFMETRIMKATTLAVPSLQLYIILCSFVSFLSQIFCIPYTFTPLLEILFLQLRFLVNDQLDAQFFSTYLFQFSTCFERGPRVAQWLRRCATSRTVPGSIPGCFTGDFSVVPPAEPCALRSTQPLKVSTRNVSWDKDGRCIWLTTYHTCSVETSIKSGVLTYPEPFGHHGLSRDTFTLHVSSNLVLIIRRINCINTISGICPLCVGDRFVCRSDD